jgi:hypothetical protein
MVPKSVVATRAQRQSQSQKLRDATVKGSHVDVNKILLDGVDLDWKDPVCGSTALYVAANMGRDKIVVVLLDAGMLLLV